MKDRPPIAARGDDAFDARARDLHSASLEQLSPRVQAQLAQWRRLALQGPATSRRPLWAWATAGGTAGALLLALQFGQRAPEASGSPAAIARAAVPTDPGAVLAEDPEFYLWLASKEGQSIAME